MTHLVWVVLVWVAIVLTLIGNTWQSWSIFRMRSGEAVSVAWFASSIGLEMVNVVYGWSNNDRLFIYNAIACMVGQTLVLVALTTYKPFGKREKLVIAAIVAVIAAAIFLPFKSAAQMAAQGINLYGGADQPSELKSSNQGTGALELWALLLPGLSSLIWFGYCLAHFGLLGPAVGYLGFAVYSAYMVWKWCKKARPTKSR